MKSIATITVLVTCLGVLTGCSNNMQPVSTCVSSNTMKALHVATDKPVQVDGRLDEPIWQKSPVYSLALGHDRAGDKDGPQEAGRVQLAWDKDYLYVGIRFEDSDIIAEGQDDQLTHFELGDLCELFLKPEPESWYWELYVTPRGYKSNFFFPGRGRLGLPSNFDYECGLKVAAQCNGTFGDWHNKDTDWTAEMAMPIKDLNAAGYPFKPGAKWRILIARYNYSRYLDCQGPELTMVPRLSQTNYHLHAEYGFLELVK